MQATKETKFESNVEEGSLGMGVQRWGSLAHGSKAIGVVQWMDQILHGVIWSNGRPW